MAERKLTSIAVDQRVTAMLDKYLEGKNLSRKEFVEKAVSYFDRTGFDLNASVSETSELQNVTIDLKQAVEKFDTMGNMFGAFMRQMQTLHNEQKALPSFVEAQSNGEYKTRYLQVKRELTELCNNKQAVRIGRIKNLLQKYFDI